MHVAPQAPSPSPLLIPLADPSEFLLRKRFFLPPQTHSRAERAVATLARPDFPRSCCAGADGAPSQSRLSSPALFASSASMRPAPPAPPLLSTLPSLFYALPALPPLAMPLRPDRKPPLIVCGGGLPCFREWCRKHSRQLIREMCPVMLMFPSRVSALTPSGVAGLRGGVRRTAGKSGAWLRPRPLRFGCVVKEERGWRIERLAPRCLHTVDA